MAKKRSKSLQGQVSIFSRESSKLEEAILFKYNITTCCALRARRELKGGAVTKKWTTSLRAQSAERKER